MKALVTGGGGFLGTRIIELLLKKNIQVRQLSRGRYPHLDSLGVEWFQGDIRDKKSVNDSVKGVDVVFHVAAKAGFWGNFDEYYTINVNGTKNIIDAMHNSSVTRLIFTSTPSVIGYEHDVENGLNNLPYAKHHEGPYPWSKAIGEELVLNANSENLRTIALRPHLIIGPGDINLMPRLLQRASSKRLVIVGDGKNRVDLTYIDNAAWAHLDALSALERANPACAGKAYFISNGEPVFLWDWLNDLLSQVKIPPVKRQIPLKIAQVIGFMCEKAWKLLPLKDEPPMTRFLANALARSHYYDLTPAIRDFGYNVRIPMHDATKRTILWLQKSY